MSEPKESESEASPAAEGWQAQFAPKTAQIEPDPGRASARQFPDIIPFVRGAYRTPPRRISLLARWFPSLTFYVKFFWVVWRASRLAKRGVYGDREWALSSFATLEALEESGVQVEITGLAHLEQVEGPALIVANHMSTLETTVLPSVIAPLRRVTFVVKRALVEMPVFKYVMRSRDPIAVGQTNAREDLKLMLTGGAERLERGVSLVVFPQGSRSQEFRREDFNSIGVKLAERSGAAIVPLALKTDAWQLGRWVSDVGKIVPARRVKMEFGPAIRVTGRGGNEQQTIVDFIETKLSEWRSEEA